MNLRFIAATIGLAAFACTPLAAQEVSTDASVAPTTDDRDKAARERKAANRPFKWEKSYKRAKALAKETGLPIAILFTGTSWCGFCVQLENNVLSKPEFKRRMKGVAIGYKVVIPSPGQYADKKDARLAEKLGMSGGVPCLLIISPDEEVLGSVVGCPPNATPDSYAASIRQYAGK